MPSKERAIEYRWADNQWTGAPYAGAGGVDTAAAGGGTVSPQIAKATTKTIPIVFVAGADPVKRGLVASLARPGGNVTGINIFAIELESKRLELLRELVPAAVRIAVLVNPTNAPATESPLRDVEAAARAMGLQVQVFNASTSRDRCRARDLGASGPTPFRRCRLLIDRRPIGGTPRTPCNISRSP